MTAGIFYKRAFGWFCLTFFVSLQALAGDPPPVEYYASDASAQEKTDYFFYEGLRLKHAGKLDAAFELFRHCLETDSTSSATLFELASFYSHFNQPETAINMLKKALAYSPDNQEYRNNLATLMLGAGMYGEAADEYEILVQAHPNKSEFIYFLAEAYTRMGEIGKAIDAYNNLENNMGMNEFISMEKYRLYMTLDKPDDAFDELKKLSDKYPMEARYLIVLGDLYLQQNNRTQALKYYNRARDTDPKSPYYNVSMANYYEQTGQQDSAKQQINEALMNERLEVDTKLSILAHYIIQLQRVKQDLDKANALFWTLLEQHPDEARLKLAFGDFLAGQNKTDEARFQYRLVTESEPENIGAWQQLLRLSLQTNDMDEAIRICNKSIELFPDAIEFYLYRGIALFQKKEYQQCLQTYEEALSLTPAENQTFISELYGQTGDTYFRIKEPEKAFEAYENALKHNDKNISVLNNYAYYLSLMKRDLSKAERMSALCIKLEPDNATYIDTYAWIFFVQGNYTFAKMFIEQALSKDKTNNSELMDHYGDILFLSGDKEKALEQWVKAKEGGKKSDTLERKIAEKQYFEATENELFNDGDNE